LTGETFMRVIATFGGCGPGETAFTCQDLLSSPCSWRRKIGSGFKTEQLTIELSINAWRHFRGFYANFVFWFRSDFWEYTLRFII
jgi:hypothetical protein